LTTPLATPGQAHSPQPDRVDEQLRLLARALIDTAVQVYEAVGAVRGGAPDGADRADAEGRLDLGGWSRYPPTPRDCGPAQRRRRRSGTERLRSPSERPQNTDG
jgi:hypothetical protein